MSPGQQELQRSAYLQAMGIASYVSRRDLPGAAPARRLVIVRGRDAPAIPDAPATDGTPPAARSRPELPRIETPEQPGGMPAARPPAAASSRAPVFSVAAIAAGGVLWLEELPQPLLPREQVQLVRAMAQALGRPESTVEARQFDWPIHRNPQLDQGEEAARAGLAAFVLRRLEEGRCDALVQLGDAIAERLPPLDVPAQRGIVIPASADMLAQPHLKRRAWKALQVLVARTGNDGV